MQQRQRLIAVVSSVGMVTTLASSGGWAAGFGISDKSVSSMGRGFAGQATAAVDGSVVYGNPALMGQLPADTFSAGVYFIAPKAEYTDDASGESISDTANKITPNLYYVKSLSPRLSAGVGVYSPFGLGLEYGDEWEGRYHSIASKLTTLNIAPGLSYQINPTLSVGATIDFQYIEADLEQAVDFGTICVAKQVDGGASQATALTTCSGLGLTPQGSDGSQRLTGSSWSSGYSLGLAWDPASGTRVGVSYHGGIDQTIDGDSEFDNVPAAFATTFTDSGGEVSVSLPASWSLAVSQQLNDRLTIYGDYTRTLWSVYDELRVEFDNDLPDSVAEQDWKDVSRYAFGLDYRLNAKWLLRAGYAWDESPVPDAEKRSPRVPDNGRNWYSLGANYRINDAVSADVAYSRVQAGKTGINNTDSLGHTLKGEFELQVNYLAFQLNWSF